MLEILWLILIIIFMETFGVFCLAVLKFIKEVGFKFNSIFSFLKANLQFIMITIIIFIIGDLAIIIFILIKQ